MKAKYGLQVSVKLLRWKNKESSLFSVFVCFCSSSTQSSEYEETKTLKNPRYRDRAESRRQTVGSEGVFQRDDAPASVHE